jgi:LacI family transcriptional regulator
MLRLAMPNDNVGTKPRPGVTVKDVAREAQVHPGTVSRALNPDQRHLISEETVRRVEATARRLGYQKSPIGRGLRTGESFTIGVVIPDLTNPLFPPLVRGIEDYLHPLGYTALLTNTDSEPEREISDLAALTARQVDGFIIAQTSSNIRLVEKMITDGTPVVLINRSVERVPVFAVTPDDRHGAAIAVDHLVELGHRRIAHLAGPPSLSPGHDRHRAFLETMQGHGLETPKELVAFAESFTGGAGVAPTEALLAAGMPFTAVFAANDLLALDCIDVLRAHGLACPDDVSVVGFNDMPYADRFTPPLTTIRFSHYEEGRAAAELLLSQIKGDGPKPRTLVLATELIVRGSSGPPKNGD